MERQEFEHHLIRLLEKFMKTAADIDASNAALAASIDKLTAAIAAILPVPAPVDLTTEVTAIDAQTARVDALTASIPVPAPVA